jgi:hypothetical protein
MTGARYAVHAFGRPRSRRDVPPDEQSSSEARQRSPEGPEGAVNRAVPKGSDQRTGDRGRGFSAPIPSCSRRPWTSSY